MATRQASKTAAEAPNIEEAMYNGVFVGVEEKRVKGGQYTKDPVNGDLKLEWQFELKDGDGEYLLYDLNSEGEPHSKQGERIRVEKLTGVGFNIASKTVPQEVRMLKALLTREEFKAFEEGEPTPDDSKPAPKGLVGRGAQLEVFIKEGGWPGVGNVVAPTGGQKGKDLS